MLQACLGKAACNRTVPCDARCNVQSGHAPHASTSTYLKHTRHYSSSFTGMYAGLQEPGVRSWECLRRRVDRLPFKSLSLERPRTALQAHLVKLSVYQ